MQRALLLLLLLLAAAAGAAAGALKPPQQQQQQKQQEEPGAGDAAGRTCSAAPAPAAGSFPSNNSARAISGKELLELLLAASLTPPGAAAADARGGGGRALAILFHLGSCPHSLAMRPVFECLPAFFPAEAVEFVTVAYAEMSLVSLVSQGLDALPVMQVNARGQKFRYAGKHWLGPMLTFVAKAVGREPLVSLEVARLCSGAPQAAAAAAGPGAQQQAGQQGAEHAAGGQQQQQQQQQQCQAAVVSCGNWTCPRWDGEATLEELTSQKHSLLFHVSLAFLVVRATWWLWSRWRRRRWQGAAPPAAGGATGPGLGVGPEARRA